MHILQTRHRRQFVTMSRLIRLPILITLFGIGWFGIVLHAAESKWLRYTITMLDGGQRMFFLHCWGTGPVEKLAQTVREALDEVEGPVR